MTLRQSTFIGNIATVTAGAMYTSTISLVDVHCDSSVGDATSLASSIGSSLMWDNPCPNEWTINDAIDDGGSDIWSTSPSFVEVCNATSNCIGEGERLHIWGHNSGNFLEVVSVRVLDGFKRLIVWETDVEIRVVADDKSVSLSGERIAEGQEVHLRDIRLQAKANNTYNLTLTFDPPYFSKIPIEVHVRPCIPGEVMDDIGEHCNLWGEGQFSLDTSEDCASCPLDAECINSTITPRIGFWNSTSKSVQIHNCILNESCSFENRTAVLARNASNAHTQGFLLDYHNIAAYGQCAQVSSTTTRSDVE